MNTDILDCISMTILVALQALLPVMRQPHIHTEQAATARCVLQVRATAVGPRAIRMTGMAA